MAIRHFECWFNFIYLHAILVKKNSSPLCIFAHQAAAAIGQLQQQQVQQTTPVKSPTPRPASRTPTNTTVQTPPTTKQGPVLNITKSTSASPQLVPPRSTLNPVPNIPILKTQTTAQSQVHSFCQYLFTYFECSETHLLF